MLINRKAGEEYGLFRYAALYSELRGRLEALSSRYPGHIRTETIGRSNEGRDILLAIVGEDVTEESVRAYERERARAFREPEAFAAEADAGAKLPVFINCNLHGSEISGTDGMLTFLEELLGTDLRNDLSGCWLFISICMNPDGRSRGFDILNGHGVDMNRDWMAQSQPEVRALLTGVCARFQPAVMIDMHGFMGSGNIIIDACTPPHNPLFEYDLLEHHLTGDARSMARVITERVGVECDVPAVDWKDGWEDYSPIYTPVYFLCRGTIAHTIETNFPSEEGAYITHCAAVGILDYIRGRVPELVKNQCEIWARGVRGDTMGRKMPLYYRIPVSGQRDMAPVYDTVAVMLRNGVSVARGDNGDFIVPASQPLRTLVHNMLWQGEDISDAIDNCYDISFYSYPLMRGFICQGLDGYDGALEYLREAPAPACESALPAGDFAVSCGTIDSVLLTNTLLRRGFAASRESGSGNFVFQGEGAREAIEGFAAAYDIRPAARNGSRLLPIKKSPRILCVGDSGAVDELLCSLGFQSEFLLFSELNRGCRIDESRYDILVAGGTELGVWNDVFDDVLGNTYQVSWALRERGRRELIRAAGLIPHRVLFGFAGARLNEALGVFKCRESDKIKMSTATGEQTAEDWMLSVPNGLFTLEPDPASPLCKGYGASEQFYLVAPVSFAAGEGEAAIRFAKSGSFQRGFNKRRGETDGEIAALVKPGDVLLGFDPSFRKYTDLTFRILTNAVWHCAQ